MNTLRPISPGELDAIAKSTNKLKTTNYKALFKKQIAEAPHYAIGPYYWFIGDNANMLITTASDNIGEITPFSKAEWQNKPSLFLAENIHPDDSFYVLSAFQLATEKIIELPADRQANVRVNIYARMLDAKKEYRWVLLQLPGLLIEKKAGQVTTCGLIMVTDLSHLTFTDKPVMMTLTDKVNNKNDYYHRADNEMKLTKTALPNITKREQEILQLMARGLNTPAIAKELFISAYTVEQHKRNLRQKTESKTSAELMTFVCRNNLF